jgi:hypothetical protein
MLFLVLASAALLAFGTSPALARHHRQQRHERRHKHHARVRHERFGSDASNQGAENETAGTVATFADGTLTIKLNDGSMVSGKVTDATEIECSGTAMMAADEHGDDIGSGDNADNGDNNDTNDNENQGGDEQSCSTASLAAGAVVQEAELKVSSGGAVWDKVELAVGQGTGTGDGDS